MPKYHKITPAEALAKLAKVDTKYVELFEHGTLGVELYKPEKIDKQQPHERDEIYVIISGSGTFYCDGATMDFAAGDFLFAPAHVEHRFEEFSDDFLTWVFFYGPKGGENTNHK